MRLTLDLARLVLVLLGITVSGLMGYVVLPSLTWEQGGIILFTGVIVFGVGLLFGMDE